MAEVYPLERTSQTILYRFAEVDLFLSFNGSLKEIGVLGTIKTLPVTGSKCS